MTSINPFWCAGSQRRVIPFINSANPEIFFTAKEKKIVRGFGTEVMCIGAPKIIRALLYKTYTNEELLGMLAFVETTKPGVFLDWNSGKKVQDEVQVFRKESLEQMRIATLDNFENIKFFLEASKNASQRNSKTRQFMHALASEPKWYELFHERNFYFVWEVVTVLSARIGKLPLDENGIKEVDKSLKSDVTSRFKEFFRSNGIVTKARGEEEKKTTAAASTALAPYKETIN